MIAGAADDLCWAVEEACLAARPSPAEVVLGGWLLRAAGGPTRRTNSLNPLRGRRDPPETVIREAGQIYRSLGRPLIVRVPDMASEMADHLDGLGVRPEGEVRTLHAAFPRAAMAPADDVVLVDRPDASWLDAWAACEGAPPGPVRDAYRESITRLIVPAAFACRRSGSEPVAVAYGVVHRGLLVFESVATHPDRRREGHATRIVQALMGWAIGQGATGACLQVLADNAPARALYRTLGFERELYRYAYRRPI